MFEAAGFKTSVREGVTLGVTDVIRIDAHLELGSTSESLTVTGEAPVLQTETPEVGTLLGTQAVIDLPLGFSGGRYAEDFAYKLTPGAHSLKFGFDYRWTTPRLPGRGIWLRSQ